VLSTNGSGTLSWAANGGITTTTGSAPYYGARAWVNFNGTGTVAISASVNVSSITDNATGYYTVNFTTAMADANYSVQAIIGGIGRTYVFIDNTGTAAAPTTSAFKIVTNNASDTAQIDPTYVMAAVFR